MACSERPPSQLPPPDRPNVSRSAWFARNCVFVCAELFLCVLLRRVRSKAQPSWLLSQITHSGFCDFFPRALPLIKKNTVAEDGIIWPLLMRIPRSIAGQCEVLCQDLYFRFQIPKYSQLKIQHFLSIILFLRGRYSILEGKVLDF